METKKCMNEVCRATTSLDWKNGWSLKSGVLASLCYKCGLAYENSIFCETFHTEESGWRTCRICRKMVHCGCIASRHLHECMDLGGIACINCAKFLKIHAMQTTQSPSDTRNEPFASKSMISDPQPTAIERRLDNDQFSTDRLLQLTKSIGVNNNNNISPAFEQLKRPDPPILKPPEVGRNEASSSVFSKQDNMGSGQGIKGISESLTQPSSCLNIFSLSKTAPPLASSTDGSPFPSDQSKGSFQMKRHVLPKPPKPSPEASSSQVRVPRPPAEGRGRGQLLPRYWPRVTDQELQQLSGDLNSTIVPLFEKILSASDAGKIGRLVLPKACAEAYFPTINQSEGIPIKIQDIKGKEWTFQFRFWPNNNSRMYVLEGVTPCIQSMQVQAGDTVIFSRRDPGGQLVIGCRKATINIDATEPQTPAVPNADPTGDTSSSDNIPAPKMSMLEKKKARNIKNKRLHMHNNDALELRINWVEAQDLLRSPPSTERSVFMVDDHEFEEFEEPPVLQKRTSFISQPSGSSSFSPEEMNPIDLDFSKVPDHKKQKTCDAKAPHEIAMPSGLDALANAAVLGDNGAEVGPTTRHPRHRPGCTCIVCIQPPSGKGRHDPSCKCNVCLTVKRRFKTLMLRKKKRLSERQAELSLQNNSNSSNNNNNTNSDNNYNNDNNNNDNNNDTNTQSIEGEEIAEQVLFGTSHQQKGISNNSNEEVGKAGLDLNSDPRCEDEILAGTCGMSLTALITTAGFPMDMYLGQNGLPVPGLGPDPCLLSRASDGVDDNGGAGGGSPSENGEQENMGE